MLSNALWNFYIKRYEEKNLTGCFDFLLLLLHRYCSRQEKGQRLHRLVFYFFVCKSDEYFGPLNTKCCRPESVGLPTKI